MILRYYMGTTNYFAGRFKSVFELPDVLCVQKKLLDIPINSKVFSRVY
jgi:hypothetical protein